nr:zinc-ribbon domain-containing protein [Escherichia coli]
MALIKCPECQKEVSDSALYCPACGKPVSYKNNTLQTNKKI